MLSSVTELHAYIDPGQLTTELGGTQEYHHDSWISHRTVCTRTHTINMYICISSCCHICSLFVVYTVQILKILIIIDVVMMLHLQWNVRMQQGSTASVFMYHSTCVTTDVWATSLLLYLYMNPPQAIEAFALMVKTTAQTLQAFGTELAETELPNDAEATTNLLHTHTLKKDKMKVRDAFLCFPYMSPNHMTVLRQI